VTLPKGVQRAAGVGSVGRARDLVETGEVSVVLAQDADRITREPIHRALLDEEAAKHGARIVALDDWGDDSHEGQLLKFMKGWVSKGERLKTAERTRRGSLRKVREGKLIRSRIPNYGFGYDESGDHYLVDEEKMRVVRRIFDEVARGASLNSVKRMLEEEGVPAPASENWSSTQIGRIAASDVYFPHTIAELRNLGVKEDVLAGLNRDSHYGVWWYNRRDVETERVRQGNEYKKHVRKSYHDRRDWVAVPVPNAGIPRELVEKARGNVASNTRPSRAGGRLWELSGGIVRCTECGSSMRTRARSAENGGEPRYYYVCWRAHGGRGCAAKRNHRAESLEREVVALVDGELLADRETLERWIYQEIERELSTRNTRDPGATEAACTKVIEEVQSERDKLVRLYTTGRLDDAPYDAYADELDRRERAARLEREKAREAQEHSHNLEANRRAILDAYGTGLQLGLTWFPPHLRRQVYLALGLVAWVSPDGLVGIEGSFDADVVRLTREVEGYARALMEADERTRSAPLDEVERELARVRDAQTPWRP
jgi:DNA invertase Pin-like site-specific DNA recombinase